MVQKYFFLLLIFLPCFAQGSADIDARLESLRKKDIVLQDSVSYLIKQVTLLKQRLNNVTSTLSNQPDQTKIANLEKELKLSQKKIVQLWMWKMGADYKLNHPNCTMNMTQIDQHLQPISHRIKTLKDNVDSLNQQESAVQRTVRKQLIQMGALFKNVNELKNKTSSHIENNMEVLKKHLFQFRKMVISLNKKYSYFETVKKGFVDMEDKLSLRVKMVESGMRAFSKALHKIALNNKPKTA